MIKKRNSHAGLTLIEVLIAVSIASILTAGIERLLDTALTAWGLTLEEAAIAKLSEETMQQMIEGGYESQGIRDAVELLEVASSSISFTTLWTEWFDRMPKDGKFYLTKRMRPGAPPPVCEVRFPGSREFKSYAAAVERGDGIGPQWIDFGFPIRPGALVRLTYQPDVKAHPELVMRYTWDKNEMRINRFYNGAQTGFNLKERTIKATSVHFIYYDGNNRPVDIEGKTLSRANMLVRISAVKIELEFEGHQLKKRASSSVNIRALGKSGLGIILAKELDIPLPDSEHIQLLQLVNFTGVDEGQIIEFKIHAPKAEDAWRFKMYLGRDGEIPVMRRYEIFYPSNQLVYEENQETALSRGFDLLSVGPEGLYDYDDDDGILDKVQFKGEQITLSVLQSDPDGVMLIVRP
ncbi:MAG: prepilin-type N-terminal cleavage/methylation domain-containing protein [Candidatus Omnitrophica bacterium]|nr:prepilin-type N-terminal cleavage/methylation domain-containing protein [Candidatus Omnitrophota bacterium]